MARATTDMFLKPYKEINRGRGSSSKPSTSRSTSSPAVQTVPDTQVLTAAEVSRAIDQGKGPRSGWATTGAAIGASAKGVGNFLGSYYKGILVDIPLATTEGLRAVPRLYGEDVKDYAVKDWKSGAIAGGKNFAHGMTKGLTGIFTQPYKGGVEEGALGVAKGFAKGTLGLTTKMSSGKFLFPFLYKVSLTDQLHWGLSPTQPTASLKVSIPP